MTDTNIANIRTGFTAAWTGIVIWVASKLGVDIDVTDPTIILILGFTGAAVWRASELLTKVPYLGYVLFGVDRKPSYGETAVEPPAAG